MTHTQCTGQCLLLAAALAVATFGGCKEDASPLAPYQPSIRPIELVVYDTLSNPFLTWIGGTVAAVGVNRGPTAVLDSSLMWLLVADGNVIRFPLMYGQPSSGATDRTAEYAGHPAASLVEDELYTYWILKADAWQAVAANAGKPFFVDSTLSSAVIDRNDSLYVGALGQAERTMTHDLFLDIYELKPFGALATISVRETDVDNNPVVAFTIKQTGVTDSLVSVFGVCYGGGFNIDLRVWEVLSVDTVDTLVRYGKKNVIPSPVVMGQSIPGTGVFAEYPLTGLERGRDYYLWIANSSWDGRNRTRTTPYYAFATFKTR